MNSGGAEWSRERAEELIRAVDRTRIYGPLIVSAVLFAVYWFFSQEPLTVKPYGDIREIVFGKHLRGLLFAACVPLIFLVVRIFDTIAFDILISKRRRVAAPQLLRDIVAIVLYFLLFSWAVSAVFRYSLTKWLTATTVIAAVLALALQETLGNLFSGIALHLEDSFEVGDVVRSGDHIGVVEGVSWRATRVRTFNNHIVILPNSVLARERIEVFPRENLNARVLTIGVDYHVPPATVINILTQAASHVEGVARDLPCFARVGSFGDSSVVYEIKYFTRDYSARDRIDADIRKAVWYAMRRNNISIPFPIRAYQPYTPPKTDHHHQLTRDELLTRLMDVDLLSPLSDEAHGRLADSATVHFYSRGEAVLRAGAAGHSMFVVHDGTVSVRLADDSPTGWHEVAQLDEGSFFGEMALLTGEARTAHVVALTDVTAIEIGKSALDPILHEHPELAMALAEKVMERRDRLDSLRMASAEEARRTILSRIRAYFRL